MQHDFTIPYARAARWLQITAVFGVAAVCTGAFGAHGLKPYLSDYQVTIFEKGVHYQFFHTLALGITALLMRQGMVGQKWLLYGARLFAFGILFFSGSLYLLACKDIISIPVNWAGPVTPIGGVCFIGGWVMLYLASRGVVRS